MHGRSNGATIAPTKWSPRKVCPVPAKSRLRRDRVNSTERYVCRAVLGFPASKIVSRRFATRALIFEHPEIADRAAAVATVAAAAAAGGDEKVVGRAQTIVGAHRQ